MARVASSEAVSAMSSAQATIRAAWIAALGSVLAAVIAATVALAGGGQGRQAPVGGDVRSPASDPVAPLPQPCASIVASTLSLVRSYPLVAAEYGKPGRAELPALADEDDVRRCGRRSPERLLETHYGG